MSKLQYISRIYRNDNGSFTDISAGLPGVNASSVAWGDYDNDGDLDILLTEARQNGSPISQIYRNDDGNFAVIDAALSNVDWSSVAWGDYDNDNDLDILLTGGVSSRVSQIYRNVSCPDLMIAKSVTPQTLVPGGGITYTLSFSNAIPADGRIATSVIITDSIPISVTSTSVVSSGVIITQTGSGYVWQVQDLAGGQGGVITVTGILSEPLACGVFTNTATIACADVEGDAANNNDAVNVTVSNVAPVAAGDTDGTNEDTPVTISVLVNDSDANSDALSVSAVGTPNYGSVVISGTTQVVYTPANRTTGYSAVFTYTASDGSLTDTATVTVTVNADDDAPTISDIPDQATYVGTPIGPITFTVGDIDTPANNLLISGESSNTTLVPTANIRFDGSGIIRTTTITPTPGLTGTAVITITVSDGTSTSGDAFVATVERWHIYLPLVLRGY